VTAAGSEFYGQTRITLAGQAEFSLMDMEIVKFIRYVHQLPQHVAVAWSNLPMVPMSVLGQSRRFRSSPVNSGLLPITDFLRPSCFNDVSDAKNSKHVAKIVSAIITNALYPRKRGPACPNTDISGNCPEQPKQYRNTLADELTACASKILNPNDIESLKSGIYVGHVVTQESLFLVMRPSERSAYFACPVDRR
jgi:hypothetical protein